MRILILLLLLGLALLVGSCDLFNPEDEDPEPYTGGTVTNLNFEVLSPNSVRLTWTENFADEDGFYVDRKIWDGSWVRKVVEAGANVTTVIDSTVPMGNVYYYKVYAFKGNRESVEGEVQYNYYLPYPYNLDYDFNWTNPNRMRLFWTNQAAWADSIVVAKRISGEQWTSHIAVLPGSATEWTDTAYEVSLVTTWGFTAYYNEHVSQQATLTMMPPK